ncbi:MAG: hypothetical protein KDA45_07140, partial [Planctomycetales bacterium]|nr:hypothetical protein [Planctomycetales bacterium]
MRISLSILLLLLAGGVLGCQDATSPAPAPEPATLANTAQASSVPLRLWIVAPSLDTPLLLRQWQADSEQPLAPRAMTEEQLLAESRCNCDVLIYPARLIGELKQRGWLANLPAAVSAPKELEESEESTAAPPAAWQQQATYAGKAFGVSLGCAVPTFVASAALGDALAADGTVAWDDVLRSLPTQESPSAVAELPDASIDRDALVDRFLAIVATVSRRDPAYGLLWDLQTLESRLGKAEFVRSAEILAALAARPAGRAALLGDHSAA